MADTIMEQVRKAIGGKNLDIAVLLDVSEVAIWQWENTKIPADRAIELEAKTGGKVTAAQLRPDAFTTGPRPDKEKLKIKKSRAAKRSRKVAA